MFGGLVILYGSKTNIYKPKSIKLFESLVILYGSEAQRKKTSDNPSFLLLSYLKVKDVPRGASFLFFLGGGKIIINLFKFHMTYISCTSLIFYNFVSGSSFKSYCIRVM